jgi:hypothetical protein
MGANRFIFISSDRNRHIIEARRAGSSSIIGTVGFAAVRAASHDRDVPR